MTSATALPWWTPRLWGAHLLLVVALAATSALGYWQWHVSADHKAAQVDSIAHEPPRPLPDLMGHEESFPDAALGRPALIRGTWVPGGTLYVHHSGGYWVVSPVAVGGAGKPAVYVIRGFSKTPHAATPSGRTSLVAWLEPDGADSTPDANPRDDILPSLQLALAVPHVHQGLYSAWAVSADAESSWPVSTTNDGTAGLRPVPDPGGAQASATTGLRNLLYAFQWWLFGCFAIYIWWRHVRDVMQPEPVLDPAVEPGVEPTVERAAEAAADADSGDPQDRVVPSQP